jgi:cytochrome c oxidase assembly protein subunit 15
VPPCFSLAGFVTLQSNHRTKRLHLNLPSTQIESRWPHRIAVVLVCATFPLIWVGGLVTTYKAGMAVPDWPTTYGYNLFLYPWQTWVFGPWDLFIEHGHRLLGAGVGMVTIALVGCVWYYDRRVWVRWLSVAALVGVILQGVLGGMRVRNNQPLLAQIHGCTGPAFFALTVALAVVTSPLWRNVSSQKIHPQASRLHMLALFTTALVYVQLILGSRLRHMSHDLSPGEFRDAVWWHLLMAALLTVHIVLLTVRVLRWHRDQSALWKPAVALSGLIALQLMLGAGTWIVKYGWPAWCSGLQIAQDFVVRQESQIQALVTTAHVAVGSLILVTSLMLTLRAFRLAPGPAWQASSPPRALGVAV